MNCNDITFRSKFTKHIQCDAEHETFVSAFQNFIALDKNTATDIIWRMTYIPYCEELRKLSIEPETLSLEMTTALRAELRHQYEKAHRSLDQDSYVFWTDEIEISEKERHQFQELCNRTNNIVLAAVIYKKCNTYLLSKSAYQIERVMFLLSANKEQLHYGGLCELDFDPREANYLKEFHQMIYDLFNVMYESGKGLQTTPEQQPCKVPASQDEAAKENLPFYFEPGSTYPSEKDKILIHEDSFFEEAPKESISSISTFEAITAENILENMDIFSAFVATCDMPCLIQISKLGFDLNEVVAKEKAISTFIEAAVALSTK